MTTPAVQSKFMARGNTALVLVHLLRRLELQRLLLRLSRRQQSSGRSDVICTAYSFYNHDKLHRHSLCQKRFVPKAKQM